MYYRDLDETVRLRLSKTDMDFLRQVSEERGVTISALIRMIIGDYRRGYAILSTLDSAIKSTKEREAELSDGDTETDIHDLL